GRGDAGIVRRAWNPGRSGVAHRPAPSSAGADRGRDGSGLLMADLVDTLDDLALLISRAEKSVEGRTFDELVANDEAYDALTYRLAMIGETSKKLPDELKERHPSLPWREMATFRTSQATIISASMHTWFGRQR